MECEIVGKECDGKRNWDYKLDQTVIGQHNKSSDFMFDSQEASVKSDLAYLKTEPNPIRS